MKCGLERVTNFLPLEACRLFSQSNVMVEISQVLGVCGQTGQNWQVAQSNSQQSNNVFDSLGSTNSTFFFEMPRMRLTQKEALETGG